MPRKVGQRKLVDFMGNAERLEKVLVKFLNRHSIQFERHDHGDFVRYYVNVKDLCIAQSVLGAIKAIGEDTETGEVKQ